MDDATARTATNPAGITRARPAATTLRLRVLSNTDWLDGQEVRGRPVEVGRLQGRPSLRRLFGPARLWSYDAALMNTGPSWVLALCALKKLVPWSRLRILAIDLILTPPGFDGPLRFRMRRWLLREVDRFVFYFRDTAALQRAYGIEADRIRYVPFKPNTLEQLRTLEPSDEGFLLACGRSNRDYATLCEAMRGLPHTCFVLVSPRDAAAHGTLLDGLEPPPNVRFISDDGSTGSWNAWVARCRALVLPILPGMFSPSGIGAYLVGMALGKPVVMTEGPATRGLLDERMAALVPPGDAARLRAAILRVTEDERYRSEIAAAGKAYALSLGGEQRLRQDMRERLAELLAESKG